MLFTCYKDNPCLQAILVAMREFGIKLQNSELNAHRAEEILQHSQVCNRNLTSKDILSSSYLSSGDFFEAIDYLWHDEGVREAYSRSSEYQLLDCAA